ncbi:transposase [Kocuria himachalensis]
MTRQKVSQRLVSDQLWELLEPLIPQPPPAKNGRTGRPRVDDRAALEGILFVTANGNAKEETPHRAGLRFRDHLLAPAAGLAGGWGLGQAPPRRP